MVQLHAKSVSYTATQGYWIAHPHLSEAPLASVAGFVPDEKKTNKQKSQNEVTTAALESFERLTPFAAFEQHETAVVVIVAPLHHHTQTHPTHTTPRHHQRDHLSCRRAIVIDEVTHTQSRPDARSPGRGRQFRFVRQLPGSPDQLIMCLHVTAAPFDHASPNFDSARP